MPFDIWTPREQTLIRRDDRNDGAPSYFNQYFSTPIFAKRGEVRMADLPENDRFIAPFVLPYEPGKVVDRSRDIGFNGFTVPYIKVKSPIRATEVRNYKPEYLMSIAPREPTVEEAMDARVIELDTFHRSMIDNRVSWMCARAFLDGKIQVDYAREQGTEHPSVLLDFGRDDNLNVTLTDDFWDDPDADILGFVENLMSRQYLAQAGGSAAQLILGASVVPGFRNNKGIKDLLDTRYRGGEEIIMKRGILRENQPLKYIGQLSEGLEVYSYKDTFDIPTDGGGKERVEVMDPKSIALIAPGANGAMVRGPIYDAEAIAAGLSSVEVFAKQWYTKDPSDFWQMHQASKLPIPLYPNRVATARVLA